MSWRIAHLNVNGVKGVLDRSGEFDLADGKSIVIYAPNGCGKSGYADAVEYLFAKDGGVEHLGLGGVDSEQGGKQAIIHVLAKERGIKPFISVILKRSDPPATIAVSREVKTGRTDPIPSDLEAVVRVAPAYRILRQHDLRRFVVDLPPRDKYSELSRWLGLEHLEAVLAHLTTTKNELAKADPDREFNERLQDVIKHTGGQIARYDSRSTLDFCCAEAKKHLGDQATLTSLAELDQCIESLKRRRDDLVAQSGMVSHRHRSKQAVENAAGNIMSPDGQLAHCRSTLDEIIAARKRVESAIAAAKESVFQEVWDAAARVLGKVQTDTCPVCLTQWSVTKVRSQSGALIHLSQSLDRLSELQKAQSEEKQSLSRFEQAVAVLASTLGELQTEAQQLSLLPAAQEASNIVKAIEALAKQAQGPSQLHTEYKDLFERCERLIREKVNTALLLVKIEDMPVAAKAVDDAVGKLVGLREALARLGELQRQRDEYRKVESSFSAIADTIQRRSAEMVDRIVQALRADVERIYQKIHPTNAVPHVYITPDTKSKTLSLRVDFHKPGRIVPPSGYLSESQINSLGVALFVACVRLFNRDFPFVFLDDIVSSYDADHRARIVDVVAEDLDEFQVFLTTHDERFYSMLKARLSSKGWLFDRITGWSLDEGPRRETDTIRAEDIEKLIKAGDYYVAGSAVRRFMEEWLDEMCATYQAHTVHKRGPKEFQRTLFDYWDPFVVRLKSIKGGVFQGRIESQDCYQRLKAHPIINYYSHAQSDPYAWGSIGDVEYVWKEFISFQKLFVCHSCSKRLKYDHDESRLYCVCGRAIFKS